MGLEVVDHSWGELGRFADPLGTPGWRESDLLLLLLPPLLLLFLLLPHFLLLPLLLLLLCCWQSLLLYQLGPGAQGRGVLGGRGDEGRAAGSVVGSRPGKGVGGSKAGMAWLL